MACLPLPIPQLPTLPSGFSVEAPGLPEFSGDIALCCKLVHYNFEFPITLGPLVINSTLLIAINAAIDTVQAYLDALPLDCPRD